MTLRWTDPDTGRSRSWPATSGSTTWRRLVRGHAAAFQLDALVAATAEVARGSRWVDGLRLRDVAATAGELAWDLPRDPQVAEFLGFLDAAARLER